MGVGIGVGMGAGAGAGCGGRASVLDCTAWLTCETLAAGFCWFWLSRGKASTLTSRPEEICCDCDSTAAWISFSFPSLPSLIKREVFIRRFKSTDVGWGKLFASFFIVIICPALTTVVSPMRDFMPIRTSPSITISLSSPFGFGLFSTITVVPVIVAVTVAVWMTPPPAFFGTCKRSVPFPRSMSRVPRTKLKRLFAPRRAKVWSGNSNSAKELAPVWTEDAPCTTSPIAAFFAGEFSGTISTWLTAREIFASVKRAPKPDATPNKTNNTKKRKKEAFTG